MELPDPVYSFRGRMDHILCLLHVVAQDVELLHVGTQGGLVHIWDLKVKREMSKVKVGQTSCTSIIQVPQGFVTLSRDESVKVWDTRWTLLLTIPVEYCGFSGVAACGKDLLIPANDGKIKIVNSAGEPVSELCPPKSETFGELMCMAYLKKSDVIVAGYESKTVAVITKNGDILCRTNLSDEPVCLGVCEESSEIIVGTSGHTITKLAYEKDLLVVCSTRLTNPGITSVSVRADCKICVAACWDKKVRFFSTKKLKLLAALDFNVAVDSVSFGSAGSRDPGLVYAGDGDGRVTIWDLYANRM